MKNFKEFVLSNNLLPERCKYNNFYLETLVPALPTDITVEELDCYGGEGQGEDYWIVFSVTKDNITTIYRINGWYASHEGSSLNFNDIYEVKRKEQVIVVYE